MISKKENWRIRSVMEEMMYNKNLDAVFADVRATMLKCRTSN